MLIALARWTERLLYRQADAIVVNSPGFVPHLVARGAEADRITVIPNGVQVTDFDPRADGEAFRRELGIGREIRLVVYTGAHGAPNDLDVLLDAAARLRGRRDVLIASIGGGRDKDRLIARAGEMGLENVRFVDARPKSRMPDVLAAADVCVAILKPIPLFDTTYPNKVFDYMAAGRPTVLAIDGVIREVVERAEGGTFVQPGDSEAMARAISSYVDDDALRKAHGRKARAYVEAHFRREEQAEALRALLEGVVAGRVG